LSWTVGVEAAKEMSPLWLPFKHLVGDTFDTLRHKFYITEHFGRPITLIVTVGVGFGGVGVLGVCVLGVGSSLRLL